LNIEASFLRSAASAADLPRDGLPEIALVGRSNVGKSSLINALVRQQIARTSAAPGKTRLANLYRVQRGGGAPFYLVDLPGYGYARGAREEIDGAVEAYFGDRSNVARGQADVARGFSRANARGQANVARGISRANITPGVSRAALLLVDSRHPGLDSDRDAWRWLERAVPNAAIVATKIDKLSRAERLRAMRDNEAVFEHPVLPVSAVTGEGLDELWKLIDALTTSE
jgi:GTP-binding protein